jgi:hypothetical protein
MFNKYKDTLGSRQAPNPEKIALMLRAMLM